MQTGRCELLDRGAAVLLERETLENDALAALAAGLREAQGTAKAE